MKLTEDQISTIKLWIESGDDLGKIQNQIRESFDINLTYLENHILVNHIGEKKLFSCSQSMEDMESNVG